ncbi:glycosyltransferase family 4 protein [uncultured Croceicoccus sp.]|uniref:glycosyltransferase family 4 protein n=1 Tax=uncultured Croceicoccus sp. TaxID=1295329 RepID=UPI00260DFFD5|nr:glycosyltransferase family 4 protein [uncultured Croceicoccus sp.]
MPSTVILVTCEYPPFPGGIGTYSGRLAAVLAADGHRTIVICPRYDGGQDLDEPTGIEYHRVLKHHGIRPIAAATLLRVLRRAPRDAILIAADIRTLLLVHLLQPLHRRPYRVMVHGSEAHKFRDGSLLFKLVRRAYLSADQVLYNSEATGAIFRAQVGQPKSDTVTYLGVDDAWFEDPLSSAFEHEALAEIPPEAKVFCSVGRLEPRKGQIETVRALAFARDRLSMDDPVYVVVGRAEDQAYADAIMGEARKYKLRTILTGKLSMDDVKRVYRRSTAHLLFARPLPGKVEGFGLVLLEAAAQKCPSIAAKTGGIPEVVADTGLLVEPDNIEELASAVLRITREPQAEATMGEAACRRAKDFSWRKCAERTFPSLYA